MKEKELRTHATCNLCDQKVMAAGMPLFWTVTVNRYGIDANALRRQAGMEMMLGSVAIAQIMGPDEDMAKPMMDPVTLTICEACALERAVPIGVLALNNEPEKVPA